MKRVFLIVLDSFGIGQMPDAEKFGDRDVNTLASCAKSEKLRIPTGDVTGSLELQMKYLPLVHALFSEVNPIPVKKALNLMGMEVGPVRMPLTEMEEEHAKVLLAELKKVGLVK